MRIIVPTKIGTLSGDIRRTGPAAPAGAAHRPRRPAAFRTAPDAGRAAGPRRIPGGSDGARRHGPPVERRHGRARARAAPPLSRSRRPQCSRGAGTTRSTSGWTVSS
ncbi:hypothetical protein F9278_36765 [Streptomyces phaeolivaceus]|uniref:Uncharacterized protein n=1 Tax=Streptomyces phaeolivaceus TaxID=2653200 RepID=A0A5P8KC31_9ACTN|nr:hypothetical protein F9278_36765 [Streptomyces phaeolivaceus]